MEPQRKNYTVLLVDDVELFLGLGNSFFHREGFDLLMASSAQEVMQLASQHLPDLVFIDMQIAGDSGDTICRWFKQDEKLQATPVVMVVDTGDREGMSLCRQAACDAIINSPVSCKQLLAVARSTLGLADRQQERSAIRIQVHFGQSMQRLCSDFSVNLSFGGLFVATNSPHPVGSLLAMKIQLPTTQKQFMCQGRVAWINHLASGKKPNLPTGMGIQFNRLSKELHGLLDDFLAGQKLVSR